MARHARIRDTSRPWPPAHRSLRRRHVPDVPDVSGPVLGGGDFRDEGISGPRRFLDKVWALVGDACRTHSDDEVRHEVLVKYHQTVKRVTEGMEELRYNTSIAALMELVNSLRANNCAHRHMVEGLVIMVSPFAAHLAEESWERLAHATSVFEARWP
jgi:leucyl-tRNA synthetase